MAQRRLFNFGFTISTALLITAVTSAAGFYAQHGIVDASGFMYIATPFAFRWTALLYAILNLPAVVVAATSCSALGRLFNLAPGTAAVIFPPLSLYISAYWWKWVAGRFGKRALDLHDAE